MLNLSSWSLILMHVSQFSFSFLMGIFIYIYIVTPVSKYSNKKFNINLNDFTFIAWFIIFFTIYLTITFILTLLYSYLMELFNNNKF